ncbi:MAG: hypothetical protein HGA38_05060 [Candidatus Moranbacteria bacterium]|nr:hypothetical protein [Candidatus Moranbacteria bacterium]NTW45885.1 hypothetical protein [Candidatus Moranbacteria bacterium]
MKKTLAATFLFAVLLGPTTAKAESPNPIKLDISMFGGKAALSQIGLQQLTERHPSVSEIVADIGPGEQKGTYVMNMKIRTTDGKSLTDSHFIDPGQSMIESVERGLLNKGL